MPFQLRQRDRGNTTGIQADAQIRALQRLKTFLKICSAGGLLDGLTYRLRPFGGVGLLLVRNLIGTAIGRPDDMALQGNDQQKSQAGQDGQPRQSVPSPLKPEIGRAEVSR